MREVALEVPNVSWDDVGGLDDIKQSLKVRSTGRVSCAAAEPSDGEQQLSAIDVVHCSTQLRRRFTDRLVVI
jgi:hypothetical protein